MFLTQEQIEYKQELIALYKLIKAINFRTGSFSNFYDFFPELHPTSNEVNWDYLFDMVGIMFNIKNLFPSEIIEQYTICSLMKTRERLTM